MISDKYNMTKEENIFLAKRNIVESIYSNARIEGINITFPETEALYAGVNVARLSINKIMIENGKGIILIKDKNLEEFSILLSEFYTSGDKKKIKEFIYENCIIGIEY